MPLRVYTQDEQSDAEKNTARRITARTWRSQSRAVRGSDQWRRQNRGRAFAAVSLTCDRNAPMLRLLTRTLGGFRSGAAAPASPMIGLAEVSGAGSSVTVCARHSQESICLACRPIDEAQGSAQNDSGCAGRTV